MTLTVQQIISEARGYSAWNASLVSDAPEMIRVVRGLQQAALTRAASVSRDLFQATTLVSSSAATENRTIDLAALTDGVERVLRLEIAATKEEVSQVDVLDQDGELAPRYYQEGTRLVEVGNDWDTASALAVSMRLRYVQRAPLLVDSDDLEQELLIPDGWSQVLAIALAIYLAQKDPGRDPDEIARLTAMRQEQEAAFIAYLRHYAGVPVSRWDIPNPAGSPPVGGARKR